jgi:NAD(P)-dependent dehydrogenase (short-subunit alcohol dehydrogenase family)
VDKLRKTLEVNLIGTIDFTEHIIPSMDKSAHIVNISSSAGSLNDTDMEDAKTSHFPFHYPAYKISKCALNMYTRTLAMRMQHERNSEDFITVSSVHPGWVKTAMGGDDANLTPEEAAGNIYTLAISKPETGQFWFNGKKHPW